MIYSTNFETPQDPLQQVYDDLSKHNRPTHFDEVLKLKDQLKEAFNNVTNGYPQHNHKNHPTPTQVRARRYRYSP